MVALALAPTGDDTRDWLTAAEAAQLAGKCRNTVNIWCCSGSLPARRRGAATRGRGSSWLIHREDLLAFLRVARPRRSPRSVPPPPLTPQEKKRRADKMEAHYRQERRVGYPILRAVLEAFELRRVDLESRTRRPAVVEARRVAVGCLHDAGLQVSAISRLLGRDHSTIIHHLQVLQERPTYEARWGRAEVARLMARDQRMTAQAQAPARTAR